MAQGGPHCPLTLATLAHTLLGGRMLWFLYSHLFCADSMPDLTNLTELLVISWGRYASRLVIIMLAPGWLGSAPGWKDTVASSCNSGSPGASLGWSSTPCSLGLGVWKAVEKHKDHVIREGLRGHEKQTWAASPSELLLGMATCAHGASSSSAPFSSTRTVSQPLLEAVHPGTGRGGCCCRHRAFREKHTGLRDRAGPSSGKTGSGRPWGLGV